MRSRRLVAVLGFASCALALVACTPEPPPPTTPPVSSVDQQNIPVGSGNGAIDAAVCSLGNTPYEYQVAQTFTAGRTGTLDRVGLNMRRISGPTPAALAISIQTVGVDGKPTGTQIGSGSYNGSANVVGVLWPMTLSAPASVTAGIQYAMVVSESVCTTPASNGWQFTGVLSPSTDAYAGGEAWSRAVGSPAGWYSPFPAGSHFDLFFDTWVA